MHPLMVVLLPFTWLLLTRVVYRVWMSRRFPAAAS